MEMYLSYILAWDVCQEINSSHLLNLLILLSYFKDLEIKKRIN